MTRGMAAALASYRAWHSRKTAENARQGLPAPEWSPPVALPTHDLSFAGRMRRRAERRAADPEFQRRLAAREEAASQARHREIWRAIREYDATLATRRIRGIGAAARRAGFA